MSIQIPGYLQWVAYLVGSQWPKGDEDAMYRIGSAWHNSSEQISALIPELNRIRSSTTMVLTGQTAEAADQQFKLLSDGNASVEKLAAAMGALGDLASATGKNIEHTKLQILTSLAIAAFEISWALAQTAATLGASEAEIPVIEESTIAAIRQAATELMKDIMVDLGETMTKTTVSRIVKKSLVKTAEGVGQDLFIQAVQAANGHQVGINWEETAEVALADATGGAAQGAVSVYGKRVLKSVSMNSYVQGELVGYSSGVVKQVVGSVATGKPIDPISLLGSPIKSAITGGIRGGRGATVSTALECVSEGSEGSE
jgi:hypothetical protein